MERDDRYDGDPVARWRASRAPSAPREVALRPGLWLEEASTSFYGRLVAREEGMVVLEDVDGARRAVPDDAVFFDDAGPCVLVPPPSPEPGSARSASGSFVVPDARARVALPSRIFVEGRHDAELVERVWGHDLRVEGVAVELLDGADRLVEVLEAFGPGPDRRAGVLLDHVVVGSKESRIARDATGRHGADAVLVVGHPFVDVWEAVRPERLGLDAWPSIPHGVDWKRGVCEALGWPAEDPADIGAAWGRILDRVHDWRDLEPAFLARVEALIDFVTADPGASRPV